MTPEKMKSKFFPYADKFGEISGFPQEGLGREEIVEQLRFMAGHEDKIWEGGKVSGSLYCGDHDHYDFLNQCFGFFSHSNALQRDICPSMNRLESEIIGMTLDMLHGQAVKEHCQSACGVLGSGGSESILNAMLAYRNKARAEKI